MGNPRSGFADLLLRGLGEGDVRIRAYVREKKIKKTFFYL